MTNHPNRLLFLVTTLFVWGAFFVVWYCYGKPIVGIDDANIYQVYMRNLAQGHGLVYQTGGERVEGFTSLLWVLIGAFFYRYFPAPEQMLLLLSVLIINVLVYRMNKELNFLSGGKDGIGWRHLFFMLLLLLIPGFFDWTLFTLMETALWSVLLTRLAVRISREPPNPIRKYELTLDQWIIGGLLVLLALTRPESMLWGVLLLCIRFAYLHYFSHTRPTAFRRCLLPASMFLAALAALTIWRMYYFGYPFPNTFYAKVSAHPLDNLKAGLQYLIGYVLHDNPLIIFMLVLMIYAVYRFLKFRAYDTYQVPIAVLSTVCLLNFVFPLLTGGDHFYLGRMLQPLMPLTLMLFTVLLFQTVQVKPEGTSDRILQGALAGSVLFMAMLLPDQFRFYRYFSGGAPLQYEFYLARHGRETGYQMSRFFEGQNPLPVWGVVCAGGIAYRYEGKTLDLLGLNNVAMAHASPVKPPDRPKNHASFDKEVFYAQQPDIMYPTMFIDGNMAVPGPFEQSDTFQNDFFARALGHIHADARFKSLYVPVVLTSERKGDRLYAYFRRQFVSGLDSNEYKIQYLEVRGER